MSVLGMFYKSFWSVKAYAFAVYSWKWRMAAYFFVLSLAASVVPYLSADRMVSAVMKRDIPEIERKLAGVEIVDWRVRTPGGGDIEFKNASGVVYGVVTQNFVDATKTKGLLFSLEGDRLTLYADGNEHTLLLKTLSPDRKDFNASELLLYYAAMAKRALPAASFAVALTSVLIYALLLSLAVFILAQTRMPGLGWVRCFKLAVLSLTPAVFVDLALFVLTGIPLQPFLMGLISVFTIYRVVLKMSGALDYLGGGGSPER